MGIIKNSGSNLKCLIIYKYYKQIYVLVSSSAFSVFFLKKIDDEDQTYR
jgi:hypothetical protein